MKNILVTGGAGYVGSVLVDNLVSHGYNVKIFDRFYFGKNHLRHLHNRVELIQGDIRHSPSTLFRNISAVIHLAGLSNDPTAEFNPKANNEINTKATIDLALQARKSGVTRFVFASSCSVYDTGVEKENGIKTENTVVIPHSPYPLSKIMAEKGLLRLHDDSFCVTVLRKGTVYGFSPRMRYDLIVNSMVRDALRLGLVYVYCRGVQWRPLVSIDDVADAYILVLQAPSKAIGGQIINISYDNFTAKDVAKHVTQALKKYYSKGIKIVYKEDNKKDRSYRVSSDKARKLLRFDAKQSIEQSVKIMIEKIRRSRELQNFDNPIYYNIAWMKPILEHPEKR